MVKNVRNREWLIGKTIKSMKIATDKMAVLFELEDGELIAKTDADCCSSTWIEHVTLPSFPAVVLGVEKIDTNEWGSHTGDPSEEGVIKDYAIKVATSTGEVLIEYRNESNGYYGGSMSFGDEHHYGGVSGNNVSNLDWKELKEDI